MTENALKDRSVVIVLGLCAKADAAFAVGARQDQNVVIKFGGLCTQTHRVPRDRGGKDRDVVVKRGGLHASTDTVPRNRARAG